MSLFYFQSRSDDVIYFDEEVSHHLLRSMRTKEGDEIFASDGEGRIFTTVAGTVSGGQLTARITEEKLVDKSRTIIVACSLIKKESRFEIFLEKTTELGVHEIVPLICDHTIKPRMRLERSMKIITAAAQQSFNPYLPRLKPPVSFEDFLHEKHKGHERFIATAVDRHEALPMEKVCSGTLPVVILIGPEGDFSDREKEEATGAGWIPVSLGSTRLRTETAAVASVQIAKSCGHFKIKI